MVITFLTGSNASECIGLKVKAFNKDACTRMIIKNELSFTHVEGDGFRELCA